MTATPSPSENPQAVSITAVTAPRTSNTPAGIFWKVLQIVLAIGVGVGLLVGGVVFAWYAEEGDPSLRFRGLVGLFGSLVCARLLGNGVTHAKRKVSDLAIAAHAEAIRLDPPDHLAHSNAGVVCAQKREFARAIAYFDAAIRLDPTMPNAYVGRVNAYGALGQFDRVIAEYTDVIRLDPNHALAYCARATACNGIGRFDRSIPDATEAIRLAPRLYLGYDARGYGLLQRGGFNRVVKLLALAWMLVSLSFLRRDHFSWRTPIGSRADLEQAVADFTEAIRLNPRAADCYLGRAQAYRALGEPAKAAADVAMVQGASGRPAPG